MADRDESAKISEEAGQQPEKDIDKDDHRPSKTDEAASIDEAAQKYQDG